MWRGFAPLGIEVSPFSQATHGTRGMPLLNRLDADCFGKILYRWSAQHAQHVLPGGSHSRRSTIRWPAPDPGQLAYRVRPHSTMGVALQVLAHGHCPDLGAALERAVQRVDGRDRREGLAEVELVVNDRGEVHPITP